MRLLVQVIKLELLKELGKTEAEAEILASNAIPDDFN